MYNNSIKTPKPDKGPPCFVCGRTQDQHKDGDYGPDGMCTAKKPTTFDDLNDGQKAAFADDYRIHGESDVNSFADFVNDCLAYLNDFDGVIGSLANQGSSCFQSRVSLLWTIGALTKQLKDAGIEPIMTI